MEKHTCWHLDQYLENRVIMRGEPRPELEVVYHPDVDDQPEACGSSSVEDTLIERLDTKMNGIIPKESVWALFKKLRKLPLDNDQVLLLIRHRGLGQSVRTVLKEMGWTSIQSFQRRLGKAEAILKQKGWKST